ncbi:LLM class F420-dependent oxidoreductase [Amycolatopsis sp. NBC_01480]|uniref:LLM class F420-dependent oxidoreductase n=1 Tax=Amycolatopsis sp. NBC_01480 TaxID=2903562 RepID=UPI002E2CFF7C|nr:LLM class F420-dependent oxidoreductase [Amycolatopsis sp. NBC_01480]
MHIGVVLPQTEIGADTAGIRRYAQRVEELGYRHVMVYDHVVGADPEVHAPWTGAYDVHTTFREPMVLFGYLAALTELELVTGILVLPQRQTALVAKQAAEVDLLTGGRFRLGVGVGWNAVEYEALGKEFHNRGRRSDEQVTLLRRLWTERIVTFAGEHERVTAAGLAPMPIQRPIPIWFGAHSAPAYRRAGRLGDGWFPEMAPGPALDEAIAIIEKSARDAGRDPAEIGMHARGRWKGDLDGLVAEVEAWRDRGATHLAVDTMKQGLTTVDEHLDVLERVARELRLADAPS